MTALSGLTSAFLHVPALLFRALSAFGVFSTLVLAVRVNRWLTTRRSATQLIVQRAGTHLGLLLGSDGSMENTQQQAAAPYTYW